MSADKSLNHIAQFETMPLAAEQGWSLVMKGPRGELASLLVSGFVDGPVGGVRSISSGQVNELGHLILTLDDLSTVDVGSVVGPVSDRSALTLIATKTASYTPTAQDHGYLIRMNNTVPSTITLVADSVEAIPVGTTYIIGQVNTGQVTIAAGAGATVHTPAGLDLAQQWAKVTVIKTAVNTWEIDGFLAPA